MVGRNKRPRLREDKRRNSLEMAFEGSDLMWSLATYGRCMELPQIVLHLGQTAIDGIERSSNYVFWSRLWALSNSINGWEIVTDGLMIRLI